MIKTIYLPLAWKIPEREQATGIRDEDLAQRRDEHAYAERAELNDLLNKGWEIKYTGPMEDSYGHFAAFVLYKPDEA